MKKRTTNKNLKGSGKPQAPSGAATAPKGAKARATSAETEVPEKDAFQELESAVQSEIERGLEISVSANAADAAEDETNQVDETAGEETNEVEGEEATPDEVSPEDPSGSATAEDEDPDGSADAEGDTEEEEPNEAESDEAEDASGSATAEEGEGESDEMSDEFLAEAEAKGWSLSAKRRLWKLLKKNEQLQQQLAERDGESESDRRAPAGTVTGREAELQQIVAWAEDRIDRIDANPQGMEVEDGRGGTVSYTAEQLRKARRTYDRKLREAEQELMDLRREKKRKTGEATARAEKEHAFLREKTSPEYQKIQTVLRMFPAVREIEDHISVLADALAWRKHKRILAAKAAAAQNGTPDGSGRKVVKPTRTVRPVVAPPANRTATNKGAALQNATKRFYESGDQDAGRQLIESILET